MALGIDSRLRQRLIEGAAAAIENALVVSGSFISRRSLGKIEGEMSIPDKGGMAEKLRAYIGEKPWEAFVIGELEQLLAPNAAYEQDSEKPLADYPRFNDSGAVARQIVDAFDSLPWHYCFTCRLPDEFQLAVFDNPLILSPHHRIDLGARLRANFPSSKPDAVGLARLVGGPFGGDGIVNGAVYLQIEMIGYVSGDITEPFHAARDDALAFLGMCVAMKLVMPGPFYDAGTQVATYMIHREVNRAWVAVDSIPVSERHKRLIAGLTPWAKHVPMEFRAELERIGVIFRTRSSRPLGLAARWLLESHAGDDELLRYVQLFVAAEVLLGDEEQNKDIGLTTLMANRCAYQIAKTPSARTDLMQMFRNAYAVRSKIVHTGKSRLNRDERQLFHMLQSVCERLIQNEIELVERAEKIEIDRFSELGSR